jgi:tetratricopeptide (TPR) repeat protein
LSLGLHTSAIALLPAVAWLIVSALRRPRARRAAVWRDVALGGVAVVLLDRLLAALGAPASLGGAVRHIVATALENQGGGAGVAYLFSARHLRDFFNAQYLIGPLAAFLFVPAAIQAARRRAWRDPVNAFVAIAAGTLLLGCWATAEPALGYARDWDLFAPAGVAFAAAGARFAVQAQAAAARLRWLTAAVALSAVHLGVWVAVNHSEPRAMARFATLPLGLGRTEVVIGNWHLRNGRPVEAIPWFERALRVDPRNSNAWAFLGMIHADRSDLAAAAHAFERATAARPDKPLYRHNLVIALEKMEDWSETLSHYEILCRIEPDYLPNWSGRAHALARAGRSTEGRALLQDWLARNASHPRRHEIAAQLRDLDGTSTPP